MAMHPPLPPDPPLARLLLALQITTGYGWSQLRPGFTGIKSRKGPPLQQSGKKKELRSTCAQLRARPCLQEARRCPASPITSCQIYYRNGPGAALLCDNKNLPRDRGRNSQAAAQCRNHQQNSSASDNSCPASRRR